jgi:enamidase
MNKILITNIEKIVSGDIRNPILEGDSILVVDGKITEIGIASKMDLSSLTTQIDAQKCVLIPGLIDSHQHPGIGDYTPTRGVSMIGWTTGKLWGGVTTIISAGEIHLPGRPMDRAGTKAMAIYLHKSFSLIRPSGIKVHGGALCITPDLIEADFEELSRNGVWIVGEVCAPFSIPDPKIVAPLTKLAHKYGT